MARFCPLFSSSSGNCIYIGSGTSNILIDCGVSAKRISAALANIGLIPEGISAVFVTHEHSDHICGLSAFAVKRGIPIYASEKTAAALKTNPKLSRADIRIAEEENNIGGMKVIPFPTSHDCAGSSGYRINISEEHSFAVCTDTGIITDEIRHKLTGCDLVMIESNHDVTMLRKGAYTPAMKQRILSDHGHLSNGSCALELPALINSGTTRIILGHLSKNNNLPEIARSTANAEIVKHGFTEGEDYILYVAPPEGGMMFSL